MKKILLIGGNPKGFDEPFDEHTVSGRRLRALVKELGFDATYLDLWDNPSMEEKWPHVTEHKFWEIYRQAEDGREVIALGLKVKRAIEESLLWFPVPYYPMVFLPHPASRRKGDLEKLRAGLKEAV